MTKFNDQQLEAINFYKGAMGVIAGAGSGKSTVLINRIKTLVETHEVNGHDILAISFTKNTADELKSKLNKLGLKDINIGTFHAICSRILAAEGIFINGQNLIKEWQVENLFKNMLEKPDINDITSYISYQKNYMRYPTDEFVYKESIYTEEEIRCLYKTYEEYKQKNMLYDFDDYLLLAYEVLKNNPSKYTYEFILVDEHQDSNLVQNLLLKELCQSGNLFVVFDYRQAIYSFRGGNPDYAMNFEKDWDNATMINLDVNYRSVSNVVDNANRFIKKYYGTYEHYADAIPFNKNNGEIKGNTYLNRDIEGEKIVEEIENKIKSGVNPSQICVLYRLNSHSFNVECELKRKGIEYEITNDSSFFKRKEINGLLGYLRLIHNPFDDSAFEDIFRLRNYPLSYFSNNVLNDIKKYSGENDLSLYESMINMKFDKPWQNKNVEVFENGINKLRLQNEKGTTVTRLIENIVRTFQVDKFIQSKYSNAEELEDRMNSIDVLKSFVKGNNLEQFIAYVYSSNTKKKSKKNCVKLMSLHASKGLEFEYVYMIGIEDGKFPHYKSELLDEVRLWYVGITRSKENLYISQIGEGNQFVDEYFGKSVI
ncbi:ATP-dependent helicase [Metabacillus arenae]|nr:ATP-dependent helicase [Metabacillus arenae]